MPIINYIGKNLKTYDVKQHKHSYWELIRFIVSPSLNIDTIKLCNRYGVPVMSGVMTPTEAQSALGTVKVISITLIPPL